MTGPTARWQPANDVERALVQALADGDQPEYFRIIATAKLYLPQLAEEPTEAQTFFTGQLFGQTVLPVYTSIESLAAAAAGVTDSYTITTYPELVERWPHPQWRLAVNPGYPIDACLPVEAVAAAARGQVEVPTVAEVVVDAFAEDPQAAVSLDVDGTLRDAVTRVDPGAYLDALLDATVVVPTAYPVADPDMILDEEDPWRVAGSAAARVIEVFTSSSAFQAAFPTTEGGTLPTVTMPLVLLLGVWPSGCALAVNPRTELAAELSAEEVAGLLLWTPEDEAGEPDGQDVLPAAAR